MNNSPHNISITELREELLSGGLVDTHYHVGPELIPRFYDVEKLARVASQHDATLVLKNHTYSTTPLAALARSKYNAKFLGSVVLNRFVGGMNKDAIVGAVSGNGADVTKKSTRDPRVVVWMPTIHAESHLNTLGHGFDPRWGGCCCAATSHQIEEQSLREKPVKVFHSNFRPAPQLVEVLKTMAANDCILATGHLNAQEILHLIPLALEIGVRSIVITHPHYPSVQLSDKQLSFLVRDPRVFIEHCFAVHTIEEVPLEKVAKSIKKNKY